MEIAPAQLACALRLAFNPVTNLDFSSALAACVKYARINNSMLHMRGHVSTGLFSL